jgi:hypothetical protein
LSKAKSSGSEAKELNFDGLLARNSSHKQQLYFAKESQPRFSKAHENLHDEAYTNSVGYQNVEQRKPVAPSPYKNPNDPRLYEMNNRKEPLSRHYSTPNNYAPRSGLHDHSNYIDCKENLRSAEPKYIPSRKSEFKSK